MCHTRARNRCDAGSGREVKYERIPPAAGLCMRNLSGESCAWRIWAGIYHTAGQKCRTWWKEDIDLDL